MKCIRWNWRAIGYWTGYFFLWVIGLIVVGAVIGSVTFPIGGLFINTSKTAGQLAIRGARFLSFIFLIWAPAVALVACVMNAWRRNKAQAKSSSGMVE